MYKAASKIGDQMVQTSTLVEALEKAGALDAPLQFRLTALANWHRELNPEMAAAYDRLVERLASTASGSSTPDIGQPLPSFVLPDHEGKFVTLQDILQNGPAVVSFNRGHWCTYCKLELFSLAERQGEMKQFNARTISIIPDTQAFALKLKEISNLPFAVLTDIDSGYALDLGLVIWVGEEVKSLYYNQGIDLAEYQGNSGWLLPIPATFVLGQDGLIKARFVDPDFRRRMDIEKIIDALRNLAN